MTVNELAKKLAAKFGGLSEDFDIEDCDVDIVDTPDGSDVKITINVKKKVPEWVTIKLVPISKEEIDEWYKS